MPTCSLWRASVNNKINMFVTNSKYIKCKCITLNDSFRIYLDFQKWHWNPSLRQWNRSRLFDILHLQIKLIPKQNIVTIIKKKSKLYTLEKLTPFLFQEIFHLISVTFSFNFFNCSIHFTATCYFSSYYSCLTYMQSNYLYKSMFYCYTLFI